MDNLNVQQVIHFVQWDALPLALVLLVGGGLVERLITRTLDGLGERLTDRRLLFKKLGAFARFFIYAAVGLVVASISLRLESEVVLALAGTIGVAVGFAFKDLLASLITGIILLMDQPFQVGDRIAFGSYYGEVTEIGLRSVRLVTLDDNLVTIPNSAFLSSAVASANAGALDCMVVIDFWVGAGEDAELARSLILESTVVSSFVLITKPVAVLVSEAFQGEHYVTQIRVKAYVFDARYEKALISDVTRRVKITLRDHGIRTPEAQPRPIRMERGEAG
ncbi:MAG: mechanosensitive ion channel [Deltaproteobacteria bacterium]|nr:mechanosensitive ion channel [Deltaproteobacteria bacterium]